MSERALKLIDMTITLKTPWLVHGNEPGRFGLDATLMRDHQNRPILPGTLVVGRIRDAWNAMKQMGLGLPDPKHWFGEEWNQKQQRSRLWINDLTMTKEGAELIAATRVPIDADTGAAENGMLMMVEQIHKAGEEVEFKGQWRAFLNETEAATLQKALLAGLLWQSQLGAQRSVGFGELVTASVTLSKAATAQPSCTIPTGHKARLRFSFDTPLCIASRSRRGNVFQSGDIISGGSLKGALATLIRDQTGQTIQQRQGQSVLARHFDALRISHAFPASGEKRPAAFPLSWVACSADNLHDVALQPEATLIGGKAPAFCHDWKSKIWDKVSKQRSWGETRSHLRVRTAIDATTRTAEESKLFAYQCIVAGKGVLWHADIVLPAGLTNEETGKIWQDLQQLLAGGLGPIGKTDAWSNSIEILATGENIWLQGGIEQNQPIRIMLNTPALLFASSAVADQKPDLKTIYQKAFAQLSNNTLELSHFYASQSMAGGEALQRLHYKETKGNYLPFVLTDAGSVFVLTVVPGKEAEAQKVLADWQARGLPLPNEVQTERGTNWNDHPYHPENGFGEILVNPQHGIHFAERTAQ